MDYISTFGEVRDIVERGAYKPPSVRFYKGNRVPWIAHDCCDSNSCSFCRKQKSIFKINMPNA